MKPKSYVFTEDELCVLRDALIEEFQRFKAFLDARPTVTPRGGCRLRLLEALRDQFKEDCGKL